MRSPQHGLTGRIVKFLNSAALTVNKIAYSCVDDKPEIQFMCLEKLVGNRTSEPPTPWVSEPDSQTSIKQP
jgi:hypothetical protein